MKVMQIFAIICIEIERVTIPFNALRSMGGKPAHSKDPMPGTGRTGNQVLVGTRRRAGFFRASPRVQSIQENNLYSRVEKHVR